MLPNANLGNRACFVKRKFASYSAKREPGNQVVILNTVFTVKNWARFCNATELKNIHIWHDSGFIAYSKLSTLESIWGRIEKVAVSYAVFTGYVWTKAVSGQRKNPDTKIFGCMWMARASIKSGTRNISEHSGTSRNILEHEKIKDNFHEKRK